MGPEFKMVVWGVGRWVGLGLFTPKRVKVMGIRPESASGLSSSQGLNLGSKDPFSDRGGKNGCRGNRNLGGKKKPPRGK